MPRPETARAPLGHEHLSLVSWVMRGGVHGQGRGEEYSEPVMRCSCWSRGPRPPRLATRLGGRDVDWILLSHAGAAWGPPDPESLSLSDSRHVSPAGIDLDAIVGPAR